VKGTDKAILLNRISYSESSLILTFYTFRNGIQKFIFQGGKKKAHQLFPLSISEITFYKRPDSDLGKITSVDCFQILNEVPFNPIKSTVAFFIGEVLLKCLKTEEAENVLFEFLHREIVRLDESEDIILFPVLFLLEFSFHMGILPQMEGEEGTYFNLMEGVLSDRKPIGDIFFDGEPVELLVKMIQGFENKELRAFGSKKTREEALQIMIQYYQLHIPQFKQLNTFEVIQEILYT